MLRREFLKLLGFGLPALVLVHPIIKKEEPKPELIQKTNVPSVCTGTNGTVTTSTTTVWPPNASKSVYYVCDPKINRNKDTWSVYNGNSMKWE